MRLVPALTLVALIVPLLASGPAEAREPHVRRGTDGSGDGGRPRQVHRPRPPVVVFVQQTVVVTTPNRCWQPGYWAYQWVPQSYTSSTWVPAQWSPDGTWIEGHYQPTWYSTGYYQPLWVAGYWC